MDDHVWGEIYIALPRPPPFIPEYNYNTHVRRINNTHVGFVAEGVNDGPPQVCNVYEQTGYFLANSAELRFATSLDDRVIFSSCPDRYIWMMACGNPLGKYRNWCSVEDAQFSLYVVKGKLGSSSVTSDPREFMNDFPLVSATRDLCRTGVEFGAPEMEWFFTWGVSAICDNNGKVE